MNNLTHCEFAIRRAFDELEAFLKEKDLGYYGYFKAVQGDILHDLYKRIDRDSKDSDDWNRDEMIRLFITSIFIRKYNPLHNLIENTMFVVGKDLTPYIKPNLQDDEGTKWDIQTYGVLVD